MKIEEYIDKNKLAFVACVSVGIAALLFVQKMTTPVKSKNNMNNANNNSHNRVAHTRTRRVRRDVHSLPAQQGITTLSHNNSSTNNNTNHSHLHRRHNNSNSINSNNNTQHNLSDLQRSQTVNHSSGALSLMTRSSMRNRSQSRQVHERSISPLTDTQLTNNNKNNNNSSNTAVTHKKKVDLTEHDDKTSNPSLTIAIVEHSGDVANNKVTWLESTSPERNIEIESSKINNTPPISTNATSRPRPMQNTDIHNKNSTNRHINKSKEKEEIVNSGNKSVEGNVNVGTSDNSNANQDSVVVTKPLTAESLHHLRQQGEVISPSSSTLTKKSHEHIAAQLTIPVNALQLSKLALTLNKDRNTNNDTTNKHGKGKTIHNKNHYHESELYKQDKEIEDIENNESTSELLVEDELKDSIPQTARAHILPLVQQQQQPYEEQQNCRNNNVIAEVQKPKLLISKSIQVNLPLRAKQHDYDKNKSSSENFEVGAMHSEVNHHDRDEDNDDDDVDDVAESKKSKNKYFSTKEEQALHEAKKLLESNGKQNNHVNKNDRDVVIAEEDAIDVSPIPHQPSNEHSPIVSHWAELSPSVEQQELTVPEHLLCKLERQIILLVEQIQQTYCRNDNTEEIYTSSEEWCWMQLYNYLTSIPTSVLSSLTCKLAKQEFITAFINEVNKRVNSYDSKHLPQALLTLEEVKKEIMLMLSSNITLEHDTHYELDKIDNNIFSIRKVKGKFKPMLTNVLVNESLSRIDDSDLEKSHRKRRFVSVTVASDSDNDDNGHDSNKEYDKFNANNQNHTSIIYNLLNKYSYLENTDNSNKNYKSNDKECNDSERQRNVNGNCNIMNISSSTRPHKEKEQFCLVKREDGSATKLTAPENSNQFISQRNANIQKEDEKTTLSENVVHLLNNVTAMAKCKEFTLLCSSAQGSHLAKEIAELATTAQHVLESCDRQTSSHEYLSSQPSLQQEKEEEEEEYEKNKQDRKTYYGFVSHTMKSLSAPPSLPTLANAQQRTESCSREQIVDEQTPQQQKLHRSNAIASYHHNDDNNNNKEDAHFSALRENDMSVDTAFDNISPAQSCPQKVYDNETKSNNYPHRPTIRSRRSRSNSPPTNNFSNGITETSPNSKLFSLSRSPFTIDIVNDDNKNNSSMVNNTLDIIADITDHEHYERKMEQTANMHLQLTKQSVFERLYSQSSNTKTKNV